MQWQGPYRSQKANRDWQAREWGRVTWDALSQARWRLEDPEFIATVIASLEEQVAWGRKLNG